MYRWRELPAQNKIRQPVGLLVKRGSLLSHSAIVAQEMGIPAIVGISNLLGSLRDGEVVTMDGASGVVRREEKSGDSIVHGSDGSDRSTRSESV